MKEAHAVVCAECEVKQKGRYEKNDTGNRKLLEGVEQGVLCTGGGKA